MTRKLQDASGTSVTAEFPDWLPADALHYLQHTENGRSLRHLARQKGVHPSTILRQVRRLENRRDDPLVDEALAHLSLRHKTPISKPSTAHFFMDDCAMKPNSSEDDIINGEARRILRRLCETTAFLALAPNMGKAVVMRETIKGCPTRTAVVDRQIAHAFALKDWISVFRSGKVTCYEITNAGRAALKRLLAQQSQRGSAKSGFAETMTPFQEQHKDWGDRVSNRGLDRNGRKLRYNLAESPMTTVGRRKDKNGKCFLTQEQMQAGDRLREDFELAQMGPRVTQNWDRFLTVGHSGGVVADDLSDRPEAARSRVALALKDLGPGLGDIALRCCCYLEGLETAERRMGWSARSGKIVLRIALQRLSVHYQGHFGGAKVLIG